MNKYILPLLFTVLLAVSTEAATVLAFTSPTCHPCLLNKPTVEQVIREGYDIRYVDCSKPENHELVKQLKVPTIPQYLAVQEVNGGCYELGRIEGPATAGQLRRLATVPLITHFGSQLRQGLRSLVCPTILFFEP